MKAAEAYKLEGKLEAARAMLRNAGTESRSSTSCLYSETRA